MQHQALHPIPAPQEKEAQATLAEVAALTEQVRRLANDKTGRIQQTAQTKLLALNALIEAARVREQGRDFSVVPQEMRAIGAEVATTEHIERREERRETNWIALIRLPDGSEIPTTIKDISPSGARLAVPSSYVLPETFMFRVVGRNFVCAVQLAWRRGDYAGVRIERVGKMTSSQARKPVTSVEPTTTLRARRSRFSQS